MQESSQLSRNSSDADSEYQEPAAPEICHSIHRLVQKPSVQQNQPQSDRINHVRGNHIQTAIVNTMKPLETLCLELTTQSA